MMRLAPIALSVVIPSFGAQIESYTIGLSMDIPGGDTSNCALLQMLDCIGGEIQQWFFQAGQLVYLPDWMKCVDLLGGFSQLVIEEDCYGGVSQQWGYNNEMNHPDRACGAIRLASSGK